MRAWVLSLLMLSAGLAGCIGGADDGSLEASQTETVDEIPWPVKALGDGHDHTDRSLHANLTTANFETVGHDPLVTEQDGTAPGGSSCADVNRPGDGKRIGAQKAGDSRGVVVTDLSDPTEPQLVGELWLTFTHIYDVAVVPDGEHVALITSQPKQGPAPSPALSADEPLGFWRDGCTGETVELTQANQDPAPRPSSLILVDVAAGQPEIVDQRPITGLGHSVYSEDVGDRTWLVGATENLAHGGRHYHFNEIVDGPDGAAIEPVSVYTATPNPDHADYLGGHTDVWLQEHPKTDQLLAYLSAGPEIEIVDLSNPNAPVHLASWTDIGPDDPGGHNLHSLHPYEQTVDGKHYTIVGPELGSAPDALPTGIVWVLDTTDPSNPQAVAAWTLPAEVTWEGRLQFSPHYMDVWNDTLFVSMYHGGVWAVDLSKVPQGSPDDVAMLESVGVYVPAREAPAPDPSYSFPWTPNLEEVHALEDGEGTLVTFDANSGVYTFTFDPSQPAPAPDPWTIDVGEHLPAAR